MENNLVKKVSYIIGYRKSNSDRENSLLFVVFWLSSIFPELEILIIEQDQVFQLQKSIFPPNCKLFFIYNSGPYNRGWAFNYGAKQTAKEILFFGDSDMFMSKENYLKCFDAALKYEVVCPEGVIQQNVKITDLASRTFVDLKDDRELFTISGGMILFRADSFEKIGGWIENFEGWGAEDNALDHLIKRKLTHVQLFLETYHIHHERQLFDGNKHPGYEKNYELSKRIESLDGAELDEFVKQNRIDFSSKGSPDRYTPVESEPVQFKKLTKKNTFILAISTFDRLHYLQKLLESWEATRNKNVTWKLIVADDDSCDGTLDYLTSYLAKFPDLILLKNQRLGVAQQFNTIAQELQKHTYDVCFKCDDDIFFSKKGWDELYYYAILESGYQHLIYYGLNWKPEQTRKWIRKGQLVNCCEPINIQGAFFTITPDIINKVGFMDTHNFGFRGYEHVDYSWRCCRMGFNDLASPYDALHSNEFIQLQVDDYVPSLESLLYDKINYTDDFEKKKKVVRENRGYIAFPVNPDGIGYKFLAMQWRDIAYDLNALLYSIYYKSQAPGKGKEMPSKNSTEFLSYLQSIQPIPDKTSTAKTPRTENKTEVTPTRSHSTLYEQKFYKEEFEAVKKWYHEQYEALPLWYKKFGHILKIITGKKSLKSLFKK